MPRRKTINQTEAAAGDGNGDGNGDGPVDGEVDSEDAGAGHQANGANIFQTFLFSCEM